MSRPSFRCPMNKILGTELLPRPRRRTYMQVNNRLETGSDILLHKRKKLGLKAIFYYILWNYFVPTS